MMVTSKPNEPYLSCSAGIIFTYELFFGKSYDAPYILVTAASFGPGNLARGCNVRR